MYSETVRRTLLGIARESVHYGLQHGQPLPVYLRDFSPELRERRATFVTLQCDHNLRGCIGSLDAVRPLVEDVAYHAYAAAFRDPRFTPVSTTEYPSLQYHISILTPLQPIACDSEAELLAQLQPGVDGLVIEDDRCHATFLPAVWDNLPEPKDFLRQLKHKAGLPAEYWSKTLHISRYQVEIIE